MLQVSVLNSFKDEQKTTRNCFKVQCKMEIFFNTAHVLIAQKEILGESRKSRKKYMLAFLQLEKLSNVRRKSVVSCF